MSDSLADIFSRKLRIGKISATPLARSINADPAECAALAALFGLPRIEMLAGDFVLTATKHGAIDAQLSMHAKVTQFCVVTLEPFDAELVEDAALRFIPESEFDDSPFTEFGPEDAEGPDEIPYANESIDLGAALAEQLALALDPYPRKPGAELPEDAVDGHSSPFASLMSRPKPANDTD